MYYYMKDKQIFDIPTPGNAHPPFRLISSHLVSSISFINSWPLLRAELEWDVFLDDGLELQDGLRHLRVFLLIVHFKLPRVSP